VGGVGREKLVEAWVELAQVVGLDQVGELVVPLGFHFLLEGVLELPEPENVHFTDLLGVVETA